MSGYLDHVLSIFQEHDHPFVLVGALAMRWHGIGTEELLRRDTIEVLISHEKMLPIADSLLKTGQWESCSPARPRYPDKLNLSDPELLLKFGISKPTPPPTPPHPSWAEGVWLKRTGSCLGPISELDFLHFCTEDRYHLFIDSCLELEAPDLWPSLPVVLEKEYHRDPHNRFGAYTWEEAEVDSQFYKELGSVKPHMILRKDIMARSPNLKIPIFVPSVSAHVNALVRQAQHAKATNSMKDLDILNRIDLYVEELYLDWDLTAKWFLSTKITESNRKFMEEIIKSFGRLPDYVGSEDGDGDSDSDYCYLPWEMKIRDERGMACDERCGYCQEKEKDNQNRARNCET